MVSLGRCAVTGSAKLFRTAVRSGLVRRIGVSDVAVLLVQVVVGVRRVFFAWQSGGLSLKSTGFV